MIYDQVYDTFVESFKHLKEAYPSDAMSWLDSGIIGNINGQSFDISSDDIKRAENVVITHGAPAIEAPAFDKIKRVLTTLPKSPEDVQRVYNENFEGVIGTSLLSGMARENTLMGGYAFQRLAWTEGRNILYGVNSEGLPDLNLILLNHINLKDIYFFFLKSGEEDGSIVHTYTSRLLAMDQKLSTSSNHIYQSAQSEIINMIRSDVSIFLNSDLRPILRWSPDGSASLKTYLTNSIKWGISNMIRKDFKVSKDNYGTIKMGDMSVSLSKRDIDYILSTGFIEPFLIPSFAEAVTNGRVTQDQSEQLWSYIEGLGKNNRGRPINIKRAVISEILGMKLRTFNYNLNQLVNNGFFNKWRK